MRQSIISIIFGMVISMAPVIGCAQNCDIPIRVMTSPQIENIPEAVLEMLNSRLASAVSAEGIMASAPYGEFFITAKFNHLTEDVIPGPPKQYAVHTSLTLYIGNLEGQEVYGSKAFDLRGVGTSTQRALINSLQSINARNADFEQFINAGRDKIITYFNLNYRSILAKANKAAIMRQYDEALYYACCIPECCDGYTEASEDILRIFQAYVEYDSQALYHKAYVAWTSSPNSRGAEIAASYISLIDPSSSVYAETQQLADEIKATVRGDFVFEKQTKYKDSLAIKKAYIDAARQIGTAYGNGQKEMTTNLLWIKKI